MKKIYVRPVVETVNVKLTGSVLEDIEVGGHSLVGKPEDSFAKEQSFDFDEDDEFGDLWGTGDNNLYDLWVE